MFVDVPALLIGTLGGAKARGASLHPFRRSSRAVRYLKRPAPAIRAANRRPR